MRHPAFETALAFAAGIAIANQTKAMPAWIPLVLVTAASAGTCAAARVLRAPHQRRVLLFAAVALLGLVRERVALTFLPQDHLSRLQLENEIVGLRGNVATEPVFGRRGKARLVLACDSLAAGGRVLPVSGKVQVTLPGAGRLPSFGDRIEVRGVLRRPAPARNPGAMDYREYLRRNGIHATLAVRRTDLPRVLRRGGGGITRGIVLPVRNSIEKTIERNLNGSTGALLKGIVLGDRQSLPDDVAEAFQTAGVVHVLAVSGGNVAFVALVFLAIFRVLPVPRQCGTVATIAAVVIYAAVTDMTPSVVRASVVAVVLLLGSSLERRSDPVNSLGVAALAMLAVRPNDLFDPGFQLSFAATFAIVSLYKPVRILLARLTGSKDEGRPWERYALAPLAVSLAAQIGTIPISIYHFGRVSLIGIVANLVVVPATGLSMTLGILAALFGFWFPPVATLFNGCNFVVLHLTIWSTRLFAAVPGASLDAQTPPIYLLVVYAVAVAAGIRADCSPLAKKVLIFSVLVGLNCVAWGNAIPSDRRLEVTFLDVGQGDCTFIRLPDGRTMIVDGGMRSQGYDAGESVVLPFLQHEGVGRVDVVVASHPDNDHIGGLVSVLQHIPAGCVLDGGQSIQSETVRQLGEVLRHAGTPCYQLKAGDSLAGLGGVGAVVLHPSTAFLHRSSSEASSSNNGSIVLRLSYAGKTVLLPGDVEQGADLSLLAWGSRLRADILKVSHHGAKTASSGAFLNAVRPEVAVISVGEGNKFGHPDAGVLERLGRQEVRIYRTDRDGAVRVVIGGREGRAEIEKMIR